MMRITIKQIILQVHDLIHTMTNLLDINTHIKVRIHHSSQLETKSLYETKEAYDSERSSSAGVLSESSNKNRNLQISSPSDKAFMKYIHAYDKENEDEVVESPNERVPRKEPRPDISSLKQNELSNR